MKKQLTKDNNHLYFWVNNEELFETYQTIRGRRWRLIMPVLGMKNIEKCSEEDIEMIEMIYVNIYNLEGRFQFYLQMVKLDKDKISVHQYEETRRAFFGACGIIMDIFKNRIPEETDENAFNIMTNLENQIKNFFIDQDNNFN
jgi:hypothetical protein